MAVFCLLTQWSLKLCWHKHTKLASFLPHHLFLLLEGTSSTPPLFKVSAHSIITSIHWHGQKEFLHCHREFFWFRAYLHIDRLATDKYRSFYPNAFIIKSRRACQSRDIIAAIPDNCCGFKHVHAQSDAALISVLYPSSSDEIEVTCLAHWLSIHLL